MTFASFTHLPKHQTGIKLVKKSEILHFYTFKVLFIQLKVVYL